MTQENDEAGPLIQMANWIEEKSYLDTEPEPRIWLAKHGDDGIIPMGEVGLVVGAGGTSKTYLMISLAIAVALGKPWLGRFQISNPGSVAMFLAEESDEECARRFYYVCKQMGLSEEEKKLVAKHVMVAPLQSVNVRLVDEESGKVSDDALGLRTWLGWNGRGPWRLVIFDSLSRFSGRFTEKDNAAAADFIRILEQFAGLPGNPAIAAVHHTSLSARNPNGETPITPRGVTALSDNCRWVLTLHPDNEEGTVSMRVFKSNYGPTHPFVPDTVMRRGDHGALSVVSEEEIEEERETREQDRKVAAEARVLQEVTKHPCRHETRTALARACKGTYNLMRDAIDRLLVQGIILHDELGFRSSSWQPKDSYK